MTEGSLYKNILYVQRSAHLFSQLLQVLFNMADVAVVGNSFQRNSAWSVGSTSTLVTLFTGFLIGLPMASMSGVAQYLGARQEEDTRNCVHTALDFVYAVRRRIGWFFVFPGRADAGTAEDERRSAARRSSARISAFTCFGMPALGIFNFGNAVLSANGDTKRPLLYLTIAGVLNVILNLFFVIVCKMAADGVALRASSRSSVSHPRRGT